MGCKVNQYDTQAMLELFEKAGYTSVEFPGEADVYLINTCTVTGVGDQKSLKLIRRVHREHPEAGIIVAGCLAQRDPTRMQLDGVRLIIGVKNRLKVVELYEQAVREERVIQAVETEGEWAFEPLSVCRHEGKTRAVMKIQEGCDRYCAYCIIPYVRGPVRSMPLPMVLDEARRLGEAGYREIIVTGIHLASYGRGLEQPADLLDALEAVSQVPEVSRIRLGSLEPVIVTEEWVKRLAGMEKICPQFHLSMQSGSAQVLKRMHRRYTPQEYLQAARRLQDAFQYCAITTDVLTGFPQETEEEALETEKFLDEVGFARIHVFPYSRRAGTVADRMSGQVPEPVKQERCARLLEIGKRLEGQFVRSMTGTVHQVLFETVTKDGMTEGYTKEYVRVLAQAAPGEIADVRIDRTEGTLAFGTKV